VSGRHGAVLVTAVLAVVLAAATGAGAARRTAVRAPITVVAAENFWGSIVKQLAGSRARVTSIITHPSTDPHSYETKPSDERTIASARYVVVNGIGYDPWAQKALDANPSRSRKVLVVGDLLGLSAGDNPHQWYSPASVERFIDRVTADLQRLVPRDTGYFNGLRAAFKTTGLQQYHALIDGIRTRYAGTPIGASESIVSPLADALSLSVLTPPSFLRAVAEGTDPTAADKETVDRQVQTRQIKVLVFNRQNSTPDVQAVVRAANRHGIPVTAITETLEPAGATFQAWQASELQHLLAALRKATGP
jgi:zinc/manganese transport system substrate-binding protein